MEDLRTAAALLNGRRAHPRIRLIVIAATQDLYQQALHEGLIQIFADALLHDEFRGRMTLVPQCGCEQKKTSM